MPSQKTRPSARLPQRRRGKERVAALLAAAADCFVDKGFDGTTMTEIAARAGASIGSLYQFFPTKEILAQALMREFAQALFARTGALADTATGWDNRALADHLINLFVTFRHEHPSFSVLTEIPASLGSGDDALAIRMHLREDLARLLAARYPNLPPALLQAAATAVQYMMKAAIALHGEADTPARRAAQVQLSRALEGYLERMESD